MKISDMRLDSWMQIGLAISRGEHPEPRHIAAALRRAEAIPLECQLYIAGLVDGSLDKRGRPKKWSRRNRLLMLVVEIDNVRADFEDGILQAPDGFTPVQSAFAIAARRHRITPETVEKYYRKGTRLWREDLRNRRWVRREDGDWESVRVAHSDEKQG